MPRRVRTPLVVRCAADRCRLSGRMVGPPSRARRRTRCRGCSPTLRRGPDGRSAPTGGPVLRARPPGTPTHRRERPGPVRRVLDPPRVQRVRGGPRPTPPAEPRLRPGPDRRRVLGRLMQKVRGLRPPVPPVPDPRRRLPRRGRRPAGPPGEATPPSPRPTPGPHPTDPRPVHRTVPAPVVPGPGERRALLVSPVPGLPRLRRVVPDRLRPRVLDLLPPGPLRAVLPGPPVLRRQGPGLPLVGPRPPLVRRRPLARVLLVLGDWVPLSSRPPDRLRPGPDGWRGAPPAPSPSG